MKNKLAVTLLAFAIVGLPTFHYAKGAVIVAPAGLDNVEGSGARYTGVPDEEFSFRHQELFLASEFDDLSMSHNRIVAMAWRPDKDKTAGSTTIDRLELRLSTTSATPGNGMSSNLDDNVGADEILVYDAPLTLASTDMGIGNPPRPFEYLIEFATPFTYDPSAGNLLVDRTITISSGAPAPFADAHDVGVVRTVFDNGSRQSLLLATEFTLVPEPSAMSLYGGGMLVGLAAIGSRRKSSVTATL